MRGVELDRMIGERPIDRPKTGILIDTNKLGLATETPRHGDGPIELSNVVLFIQFNSRLLKKTTKQSTSEILCDPVALWLNSSGTPGVASQVVPQQSRTGGSDAHAGA